MTRLDLVIGKGLASERPVSAPMGALWYSTDTGTVDRYSGTDWEPYISAGPEGPQGPQGPAGEGVTQLTTKGDILSHDGSVLTRVPAGTEGHVLKSRAAEVSGLAWEAESGGGTLDDPTTTLGDLLVNDGTDLDRLPVGTDGQILKANSAAPLGLAWEAESGGGGGGLATKQYHPGFVAGRWYGVPEQVAGGAYGQAPIVANEIWYEPFYVPDDITIDRIATWVVIASAGTIELGIYENSSGQPGARVATYGTVDTGTTGEKPLTISQALTGGLWYWLAMVGSSTPTIRYYNANSGPSFIGKSTAIADTVGFPLWKETGASLPVTAGTLVVALSGVWLIRVRVA